MFANRAPLLELRLSGLPFASFYLASSSVGELNRLLHRCTNGCGAYIRPTPTGYSGHDAGLSRQRYGPYPASGLDRCTSALHRG